MSKVRLLNGISRAREPDNPIPGGSGPADEGDEDDGDVPQQDRVHAAVNINLLCCKNLIFIEIKLLLYTEKERGRECR